MMPTRMPASAGRVSMAILVVLWILVSSTTRRTSAAEDDVSLPAGVRAVWDLEARIAKRHRRASGSASTACGAGNRQQTATTGAGA